MKGWMKWIGLSVGLALPGRLITAFFGFLIGYAIDAFLVEDKLFDNAVHRHRKDNLPLSTYQIHLMALVHAMLHASGMVSQTKLLFIQTYLTRQFGNLYAHKLMRLLQTYTFMNYAVRQSAEQLRFTTSMQGKMHILQFLKGIATADHIMQPNEVLTLQHIAKMLGVTQRMYASLFEQENRSTHSAYSVLGVLPNATDEAIKKAYRKLVLQFHPDRHSKDKEAATKKFNAVQQAFETIKKMRNFN